MRDGVPEWLLRGLSRNDISFVLQQNTGLGRLAHGNLTLLLLTQVSLIRGSRSGP
jgi:hypothetical protein